MENSINNRKKKKVNAFDILLIVIALALAFAAFWILDPFYLFSGDQKQPASITYVVVFRGVDDDVIEGISQGSTVTNASTGDVLGKATSVRKRDAVVWEYVEGESNMVKKTLEGKSDVYVTIHLDCVYEQGIGYTINGQQIAYGTDLSLRLSGFVGTGECVSLSVSK